MKKNRGNWSCFILSWDDHNFWSLLILFGFKSVFLRWFIVSTCWSMTIASPATLFLLWRVSRSFFWLSPDSTCIVRLLQPVVFSIVRLFLSYAEGLVFAIRWLLDKVYRFQPDCYRVVPVYKCNLPRGLRLKCTMMRCWADALKRLIHRMFRAIKAR